MFCAPSASVEYILSYTLLAAFFENLLLYKSGLDARYGAGTADGLEERYRDVHFKGKTTEE
jgi:hypothetical protein